MRYETIDVRFQETVCFLQFTRANNTITHQLVDECVDALQACESASTVVVLSGTPETFCVGADFQGVRAGMTADRPAAPDPEPLYDLWLQLATGPYVTVSHVRGKANAGGLGFVAASDIVIADGTAQFSLSELLFGLYPACVLPFLIRRIGVQRANYLTLMTQPVPVQVAAAWGLVDAHEPTSDALLRRHLQRLRRLSKPAVLRYKNYINTVYASLRTDKPAALRGNREVFNDPNNLQGISRFVESGLFPWEA